MQVVEVRRPFALAVLVAAVCVSEWRKGQEPIDRLRRFRRTRDARILDRRQRPLIVVCAQDDRCDRVFLAQRLRHRQQVARVERNDYSMLRALMQARAGRVAFAYQNNGLTVDGLRLADREVPAALVAIRQVVLVAFKSIVGIGENRLERMDRALCIADWHEQRVFIDDLERAGLRVELFPRAFAQAVRLNAFTLEVRVRVAVDVGPVIPDANGELASGRMALGVGRFALTALRLTAFAQLVALGVRQRLSVLLLGLPGEFDVVAVPLIAAKFPGRVLVGVQHVPTIERSACVAFNMDTMKLAVGDDVGRIDVDIFVAHRGDKLIYNGAIGQIHERPAVGLLLKFMELELPRTEIRIPVVAARFAA
ncbi:hypothetical protein P3T22_005855 [Paraburkholderia sp. GAS348]